MKLSITTSVLSVLLRSSGFPMRSQDERDIDDDYYLYDVRHPGVRILVIVVE